MAVSEGRSAPGASLTGFSYGYVLGFVYRITGSSLLIGSLLSCVAWLASAYVLRSILRMWRVQEPVQWLALLVYSVLPSSVLWTSVTLREPYQLLSVNLMVWATTMIWIRPTVRASGVLLVSAAGGAFLHSTLLALGVVVVGSLLLQAVWTTAGSRIARAVGVGVIVVGFSIAGVTAFRTLYWNYRVSGGLVNAVALHHQVGMRFPSRTLYKDISRLESPIGVALYIPVSLWQYLFEPMPWKMNRLIDVGFLAENVLRAILIGCALAAVGRLEGASRLQVAILLAWYLVIEMAWAVGTFNWGTAARHHLPATGLLLTAAAAMWSRWPVTAPSAHS
ncbi:MAG: hypothetical protein Q8O42_02015 [Acidobacteriota bacterium]|nr:hypothetical protein [Acidobacteriota bacterium]